MSANLIPHLYYFLHKPEPQAFKIFNRRRQTDAQKKNRLERYLMTSGFEQVGMGVIEGGFESKLCIIYIALRFKILYI